MLKLSASFADLLTTTAILDLVYVGIAYKLGNMLKNSIREGYFLTGLLYFVAIYMNAYNCWERKMAYDARCDDACSATHQLPRSYILACAFV